METHRLAGVDGAATGCFRRVTLPPEGPDHVELAAVHLQATWPHAMAASRFSAVEMLRVAEALQLAE